MKFSANIQNLLDISDKIPFYFAFITYKLIKSEFSDICSLE